MPTGTSSTPQHPNAPLPSSLHLPKHGRAQEWERGARHTYPDDVLVDHYKADKHGHVGQHGEDGQDLEVLDEGEQHHERQDGKHVQAGVHGGGHHHCPVWAAVIGGPVCSRHHLGKHRKPW